ncbi:amino acid transporter [Bimuria novae-zelandiae CBS 107.79]|uniref:Amino acid transporter n=1 Tax=Bimuria novae-zelandiae CBS 107.79 TaxID=1447943 RepID=A0A6A5VH62_9PLEO|nr:amino acid transporter [Bimuria novae-zelandiae CBS 107.79]
MKEKSQISTLELQQNSNLEAVNDTAIYEKHGTQYDKKDMNRMGKLQQLSRNFQFFSILSVAAILGSTWEFALVVIGISLSNGGPAGGIWMFLVVCFGMFFVTLSMAEMASMMPISGGQYHWVSELAPKRHQKLLSYIVGWMCAIGWQCAMATTALAATQQLQGLIAVNIPSYVIKPWHSTLFCIAVAAFAMMWNVISTQKIPLIEGVGMVLYILGFFTFVIVLWIMAPHTNTKDVWTKFEDNSGWGNVGLSTLIGILGPLVTLIGSDSSCHLSEETVDAAWVLPRAMVATATLNYTIGFIMMVTVMSSLGNDVSAILDTTYGQPWIQVLFNATQSRAGTSIMIAIVCVLLLLCSLNSIMTTSRQLFALARDKGLPFSDWLAYIHPKYDLPVNALLATCIITSLLSLIILGSTIAFNIITSLGQLGLVFSYLIAITCMVSKRFRAPNDLLRARFSLGRAGVFINALALCFLTLVSVLLFFPAVPNPSAESMNWSCLMFGGLVVFALGWYWVVGRYRYVGPVMLVKKI